MADPDHFHRHALVVDGVDDPIGTLAYAIQLGAAGELLAARCAWVVEAS